MQVTVRRNHLDRSAHYGNKTAFCEVLALLPKSFEVKRCVTFLHTPSHTFSHTPSALDSAYTFAYTFGYSRKETAPRDPSPPPGPLGCPGGAGAMGSGVKCGPCGRRCWKTYSTTATTSAPAIINPDPAAMNRPRLRSLSLYFAVPNTPARLTRHRCRYPSSKSCGRLDSILSVAPMSPSQSAIFPGGCIFQPRLSRVQDDFA